MEIRREAQKEDGNSKKRGIHSNNNYVKSQKKRMKKGKRREKIAIQEYGQS